MRTVTATLLLSIVASHSILAAAQLCNTAQILCCNVLLSPTDPTAIALANLTGISPPANGFVGMACNPVSVLGISANECPGTNACCQSNIAGVMAIGCIPVIP